MPRQPPRHPFPIPYAVDFTTESKGRHLDSTKRKISWKFGFAHPPTIFPHLFDNNEEYVGYKEGCDEGRVSGKKLGVDCRGREHEIVLVWSLVSGKAHIYVDNKELFRHTPPSDEIFNPFTAQFHHGFNLPNSKYNGHHRIDIRCYARTPLGAKNMAVDNMGGRFHQYDLTVDGLSYFSMPAVYELGTDKMWIKVERWGLVRAESRASGDNCTSSEEERNANARSRMDAYEGLNGGSENGGSRRLVDEYYFDKAKQQRSRSSDGQYGRSISRGEYNAMSPRSESEEDRMMRIAMEASMRDLDNDRSYGPRSERKTSSTSSQQRKSSNRQVRSENNTPRLAAVGEDENLIDFGDDEVNNLSRGVSQILFTPQQSSDVSVLGDDDATTASFMVPYQPTRVPQQQPFSPPANQPYQHQFNQQQPAVQPSFQDPTFNAYSSPTTPRFNDAASFAYAPPPTWDDYKDAFGGSVTMNMGASVAGSMIAPSLASPLNGSASFAVPQQQFQQPHSFQPHSFQPQQYGAYPGNNPSNTYPANQWQMQSKGAGTQQPVAANTGKNSMFDPLRQDPFGS